MSFFIKSDKFIWFPRILSVLLIAFFSLFAFDVFDNNTSFSEKSIPFLIHLIPALVLIITLIFSWKLPAISGWIFIIIGIAFMFYFNTYKFFVSFLIISLSPIIIGLLFLISSIMQKRNSTGSQENEDAQK